MTLQKGFRLHTLAAAAALFGSAAWACQPPPIRWPQMWMPAAEAKLPVVQPNSTYYSSGPGCPYTTYDSFVNLTSISDADWEKYVGGTVTVTPPLPAAWDAAKVYVLGDQASFDGKAYTAKWWTQGEQPGTSTWGAWEEQAPLASNGSPAAWLTGKAYAAGNEVNYLGFTYRAKWWTQGDAPSTDAAGPWEKTGVYVPTNIPVAARPAPFTAKLVVGGGLVSYTWQTQSFTSGSYAPIAYFEIRQSLRIPGNVQRFNVLNTIVSDCPPPVQGKPNTCQTYFIQSGTGNATWITLEEYASLWVCTAQNVCRPSPATYTRYDAR